MDRQVKSSKQHKDTSSVGFLSQNIAYQTSRTKLAETEWLSSEKLIVTQLFGDIDHADVDRWINSLESTFKSLPDNQTFKILVNLHGFKAVDIGVHKKFRGVIPELLARYGWKTGYVNLFEEAKDMVITTTRGMFCIAAAHVHDDQTKIEKYETMFGRANERFFTNLQQAKEWIQGA